MSPNIKDKILFMLEERRSRKSIYNKFKADLIGLDAGEYFGKDCKEPHSVFVPHKYHLIETLCAFMMHRFLNIMLDEVIECLEELERKNSEGKNG